MRLMCCCWGVGRSVEVALREEVYGLIYDGWWACVALCFELFLGLMVCARALTSTAQPLEIILLICKFHPLLWSMIRLPSALPICPSLADVFPMILIFNEPTPSNLSSSWFEASCQEMTISMTTRRKSRQKSLKQDGSTQGTRQPPWKIIVYDSKYSKKPPPTTKSRTLQNLSVPFSSL